MEHWCVSTQAMLFSYLHWMKALKSDTAKGSAEDTFDQLISKTLGSNELSMIVSDVCPVGAIPTSGLRTHYSGGVIHDASDFLGHFPLVGKALNRKEHRKVLLGSDAPIAEGVLQMF